MKHTKKLWSLLLAMAMIFSLVACGNDSGNNGTNANGPSGTPDDSGAVSDTGEIDASKVEGTIRMTTTSLSSNGQILGSAMCDIVSANSNLKTSVIISAGSGENAFLLSDKEAELAIMTPDVSFQCLEGMDPYGEIEMYAITKTFTNQTLFAVRADSGIESMEDLKGKRIAVGATGSGPYELAKAVLGGYGLWDDESTEKVYLNTADCPDALKDGSVDAMVAHLSSRFPASYLSELDAGGVEVRYLGVSEEAMAKIQEELPFEITVNETVSDTRLTQLKEDILCMSNTQYVAVRPDVSEEVVYAFTKTLMENAEQLDAYHSLGSTIRPETALEGLDPNIPIHPGAARYYKEIGVWDDTLTVGTVH